MLETAEVALETLPEDEAGDPRDELVVVDVTGEAREERDDDDDEPREEELELAPVDEATEEARPGAFLRLTTVDTLTRPSAAALCNFGTGGADRSPPATFLEL